MKSKIGAASAFLGVFLSACALMLALSFAPPVAAQTIGSSANGGSGAISDSQAAGQLIVPPSALPLTSFSFWVERASGSPSFSLTPYIQEWGAGAPVGPELWTGASINVYSLTPVQITFSPNLVLDPTKRYVVLLKNTVAGEAGWLESGTADQDMGHRVSSNPWGENLSAEAHFTATFGSPAPAAIPTMTEWGMILFGVLLAGGAALFVQQRQRAV